MQNVAYEFEKIDTTRLLLLIAEVAGLTIVLLFACILLGAYINGRRANLAATMSAALYHLGAACLYGMTLFGLPWAIPHLLQALTIARTGQRAA